MLSPRIQNIVRVESYRRTAIRAGAVEKLSMTIRLITTGGAGQGVLSAAHVLRIRLLPVQNTGKRRIL